MRALFCALAFFAAAAAGGCTSQSPVPGERTVALGEACGGLAGVACGEGAFCNYPPQAQCGAADQTGVCERRPDACTMQYDPVCGCDGETYGNACVAASHGVSVAAKGECPARR